MNDAERIQILRMKVARLKQMLEEMGNLVSRGDLTPEQADEKRRHIERRALAEPRA